MKKRNISVFLSLLVSAGVLTSCSIEKIKDGIFSADTEQSSIENSSTQPIQTDTLSSMSGSAENETNADNTDFSENFYYNLLDSSEKELYEEMYQKLGEFPETVSIKGKTEEQMQKAFNYVLGDYPEWFWFDGGYNGMKYNILAYKSIKVDPGYRMTEEMANIKLAAVKEAADYIAENAMAYDNDYEKALYVHDYIIENCSYDETVSYEADIENSNADNPAYSLYGCLVNKRAVCSGYSAAYQYIMKKLGIPCGRVTGVERATGVGHEWNFIVIDGKEYYVDLTWDDPTGMEDNFVKHNYFLISTDDISKSHDIDQSNLYTPSCAASDNYYVRSGKYIESYDVQRIEHIITENISEGAVELRFSSGDILHTVSAELFDSGGIYNMEILRNKEVSYSLTDELNTVVIYWT